MTKDIDVITNLSKYSEVRLDNPKLSIDDLENLIKLMKDSKSDLSISCSGFIKKTVVFSLSPRETEYYEELHLSDLVMLKGRKCVVIEISRDGLTEAIYTVRPLNDVSMGPVKTTRKRLEKIESGGDDRNWAVSERPVTITEGSEKKGGINPNPTIPRPPPPPPTKKR